MSSRSSSRSGATSATGFSSKTPKLPGVRSASAMGQVEGAAKRKQDKDRSMQSIVQIYKTYVRPEQKGLTVSDFRKMFEHREGPLRKQADKRVAHYFPSGWSSEICEDMFRVLDKDKDGYVVLNDFLRFYAPKQLSKIPKWTFTKKNNKKIISTILDKLPTPHLPEADQKELHEVFHLWVADAESDGALSRDEVMEILAGRKGAVFNWLEAREAADRLFEGVNHDTITFAEFANHLQDVMTVPYNHLMSGEVKQFKQHRRQRDSVGRAADRLRKRPGGERGASSGTAATGVSGRGVTDGLGKGGRLEPLAVTFEGHAGETGGSVLHAPRPGGSKAMMPVRAASMRVTRREQVGDSDSECDGSDTHSPAAGSLARGNLKDFVGMEEDRPRALTGSLRVRQPASVRASRQPHEGGWKLSRAQTLAKVTDLKETESPLAGRALDADLSPASRLQVDLLRAAPQGDCDSEPPMT